MIRRPFDRPGSRICHVRVVTQTSQDANCEVVSDLNLAGQSQIVGHFFEPAEPLDLRIRFRRRFAAQNLDTTRRAPGISAASVQDIDTGVFDCEHQPTPFRARGLANTFDRDNRHQFASHCSRIGSFPRVIVPEKRPREGGIMRGIECRPKRADDGGRQSRPHEVPRVRGIRRGHDGATP